MEKQTKIIIGVAALGVAYLIWKKKLSASAKTTITPAGTTTIETPKGYPAGLKDGDYIRYIGDATIYLLKDGKKLPITYDWMVTYAGDKWGSVIEIEPATGDTIPVGETLVV